MPLAFSPEVLRSGASTGLLYRTSALGLVLAAAAFGGSNARAADECGSAASGSVTCTAAGNPYATGITYAAVGNITVTTNADVAATNTIRVTGPGVTIVNNAGTVTTTLANQPAIVASGTSATVTSTGNVSTAGAAGGTGVDGITVTGTTGNATATVRNIAVTGNISGVSRPRALVVTTNAGNTTAAAVITGAVSSANGDAVVITGGPLSSTTGTAAATVNSGGSITGGVNGLVITGRSATTVDNAGTIVGGTTGAAISVSTVNQTVFGNTTINNSGTIGSGDRLAILAAGGPATINNSGTINGRVLLTTLSDTFNNSGVFNATSNSDFGGDASVDVFNNSGTLNVLGAASSPSTMEFTGLEVFNNSGTISLVNGQAFNTLTLPGTYNGTGGSRLVVDVTTGAAPLSDRLVITGAATGSTAVVLNSLTPANASVNAGLIVATGGAGSSANAFSVAAQSQNVGFINYIISPTVAAGGTTYSLVGTPGDSVVRALKINEGAQNLWHNSADAWAAHTADIRTAQWGRAAGEVRPGGIWFIAHGGVEKRHDSKTTTAFGFSRSVDTSYQQDDFGIQIGGDLGGFSGLVFGITAGYGNSRLKSLSSSDRSQFETVNAGIYAGFVSGPLFANVLAKYDHVWIDSQSPVASFSARYDGNSYGVQGELGVQLGSETFFVEPSISAAYVRTDLDSPVVSNATLTFAELDGVRGKAGLRVGTSFDVGGRGRGVAYLSAHAVHEFEGDDGVRFISNGVPFTYANNHIGTYAEAKIGVNIVSAGVLSGFIEGFGKFADEYSGGGARAGLRLAL